MANAAQELAQKAASLIEQLQPEKAVEFFQQALQIEPKNVAILDQYADCLIEIGRDQEAQHILQTSIELSPNENPFKYMNLGQLLSGHQALQCFSKGTELLMQMPASDEIKIRLASGLCSMAELYMTDLCDEPNAEATCEALLGKAVEISPHSVDVHQSLASLRLIQERFEDASSLISRCLELIDGEDEDESSISFEMRLDLAKMCIELDRYSDALDLIDRCLCDDDSVAELWVLAGLCYIKEEDYENAHEFLGRAQQILSNEPDEVLQAELDAMLRELKDKPRAN